MYHISSKPFLLLTAVSFSAPAIIAAALLFFISGAAESNAAGNTYYVATNGDDSSLGASGSPFRTIKHGVSALSAGDTLKVRPGDYTESFVIANFRATSWATATIIEAETPGTVKWFATSFYITGVDNSAYVIVRGFTFDGSTGTNNLVAAGKTTLPVTYAERLLGMGCTDGGNPSTCSHHVRWENNIIRNSSYVAMQINKDSTDVEILNNEIYNIGKVENSGGFYSAAPRTTYDGNYFHDIQGVGINYWNQNFPVVNDGIARNNLLVRNGYWWAATAENGTPEEGGPRYQGGTYNTRYGGGIGISRGSGTQVYNNILIDTVGALGAGYGAKNCLIANNTVYGNPVGNNPRNIVAGIHLSSQDGGSTNCVVYNNIVDQPGVTIIPTIVNDGVDSVLSHNLCSSSSPGCTIVGDPKFLNPSANDFHLQSNSSALNAGISLPEVPTDFEGTPRPQGGSYDIGADEYGPGAGSSPTPTPTPTPAPQPPVVTISALPSSISTPGQGVTLQWSSTNAISCTASNGWTGTKSTGGVAQVTPSQSTIYTLTCTGASGTGSGSATVTVGSASLCSQYTNTSTIPTGFGVPWDVLSPSTMLMSATCTPPTILLKAGNPSTTKTMYVYKTAYVAPSGATGWTPIDLFGSSLISNAWYPKSAQGVATVQDQSIPTYYVAYTCQWIPPTTGQAGKWLCGCRDATCAQSYWMVQRIMQ